MNYFIIKKILILTGTAFCSSLVFSQGSFADNPQTRNAQQPLTKQTQQLDRIDIEKMSDNPEAYYGKRISVVGRIDKVYGPKVFKLENDDFFKDRILAVFPKQGVKDEKKTLVENQKVRVIGTLKKFDRVDVEKQIGWDLDPELEVEYEGTQPILVVESMKVLQNDTH